MADMTRPALQLAETTVNAVDQVVLALLRIVEQKCLNPEDADTLKNFSKHISKGGHLKAVPVQGDARQHFEKLLNESGVLTYKADVRTETNTSQYLFKDIDKDQMDRVIVQMKDAGIPLVKDCSVSVADIMERGSGKTVERKYVDRDKAAVVRLELDIHETPYAAIDGEESTTLIIAEDDFITRIKNIPALAEEEFASPNKKKSLREEAALINERKAQEVEKDHSDDKSHTVSSGRKRGES